MKRHLLWLVILGLALSTLVFAVRDGHAQATAGSQPQGIMMLATSGQQEPDLHMTPMMTGTSDPHQTPQPTGTHEPDPHMTPMMTMTPDPHHTPQPTGTPRNSDTVPPTGTLTINGGAQVTSQLTVTLTFTATDNPGGTGVAWIMVHEWGWDMSQGWHDMHPGGDCGGWMGHMGTWQPYTATAAWQLSPGPGVKYVTAWFADAAWNISRPAMARINLVPQPASLRQGEGHHYRYALQAGQAVTISLHMVSGDPDLYIWQPGWVGTPDWVSNGHSGDEQIAFVAPMTGVYLVEVRGYAGAVYNLNFKTNGPPGSSRLPAAADKPLPTAPLVTTAPDVTTAPQAGFKTYVSLLVR